MASNETAKSTFTVWDIVETCFLCVFSGVCSGQCLPGSRFLKRKGYYELGYGCCQPETTVSKTVFLKCSMNTTQAFNIKEAASCACHSYSGMSAVQVKWKGHSKIKKGNWIATWLCNTFLFKGTIFFGLYWDAAWNRLWQAN